MRQPTKIPTVAWNHTGVTILWAPRSPCNLNCQYCYFGTVEEHQRLQTPLGPGELSHKRRDDASIGVILSFIGSLTVDRVHRVFIAGGEPLNWAGIKSMISAFKKNGIQVVICTNGLPLGNKEMSSWLINSEVEAVSVSLDSHEPEYNDKWRKDPSGGGWQQVVKGIQTLMEERERANSRTRVGIYSVITSLNIDHILKTALFVNKLGVDYLIIQPVSLVKEHRLHDVLSLSSQHHEVLSETLDLLMKSPLKIRLPNDLYLQLILHSLQDDGVFPQVRSCFGGKNLFFIEPDGSIWDCPSVFKIAKTPPEQFRSIQDQSVVDLFLTKRLERNTDCSLFSQDCVNMWQLMAFDDIIN